MTKEQAELLNLEINPISNTTVLMIENALQWVIDNTTLEIDETNDECLKALPPNVRLFILKYIDIMNLSIGITSESISGLSQSFDTTDKTELIWQLAECFLGKWLKSKMRFVAAPKRWN